MAPVPPRLGVLVGVSVFYKYPKIRDYFFVFLLNSNSDMTFPRKLNTDSESSEVSFKLIGQL